MANYTYSISSDTASGSINLEKLTAEINITSITGTLDYINTNDDVLDLYFSGSLSGGSLTALSGVIQAHDGVAIDFKDNFIEEEYNNSNHLVKETYYAEEDNNGNLIYKTRQIDYNYNGIALLSEVEKEYDLLGNIISTVTRNFETETVGSNTIVRKRKV